MYDTDNAEMRFVVKWLVIILVSLTLTTAALSAVFWGFNKFSRHADTVLNNALINYEEFQEMYNAAQALNTKICNMKEIPEDDGMFKNFSKNAQIIGLKNNLVRWIEEYNAKSKMWNRDLWKSKSLPHQLSTANFSCY